MASERAAVAAADIGDVFRREYGRAVSILVRVCGSFDTAEDAVQDAFATALEQWPKTGLPPSPAGWIVTTARNRAIDRMRRESTRSARHAAADWATSAVPAPDAGLEDDMMEDERLRLIFTCCHPALAPASQVALTLRLLGGLDTHEIARSFLVPEATMAQRIVRAKRKIRDTRIPYRVPSADELPARRDQVLAVLYLIFNEGYASTASVHLLRPTLCDEAIRLARALATLMPAEPEVLGCWRCCCWLTRGVRRAWRRRGRWCLASGISALQSSACAHADSRRGDEPRRRSCRSDGARNRTPCAARSPARQLSLVSCGAGRSSAAQ